jgi:uncharacterized protein (DUF608 family)
MSQEDKKKMFEFIYKYSINRPMNNDAISECMEYFTNHTIDKSIQEIYQECKNDKEVDAEIFLNSILVLFQSYLANLNNTITVACNDKEFLSGIVYGLIEKHTHYFDRLDDDEDKISIDE